MVFILTINSPDHDCKIPKGMCFVKIKFVQVYSNHSYLELYESAHKAVMVLKIHNDIIILAVA